jgi:hypothetical protein
MWGAKTVLYFFVDLTDTGSYWSLARMMRKGHWLPSIPKRFSELMALEGYC